MKLDFVKSSLINWVWVVLTSICATYLLYLNFFQTPIMSRREVIPAGFAFLIIFLISLFFFDKIVFPSARKSAIKRTRELAVLSIAIGAFLAIVAGRPPQNYRLLSLEDLKIQTLQEKNPRSNGSRVVLKGFDTRLYDISYSSFELEGEWERDGNNLAHNSSEPAAINWRGKTGSLAVLYFETNPEAGMVTVSWNDKKQIFDLYSETPGDLVVDRKFQIAFTNYLPAYLSIFFLGALLFFSLSLILLSAKVAPAAAKKVGKHEWLRYVIPMIIVWGILLLTFWPGMMSPDSMDQWGQLSSGIFDDSHPIAHTLMMWLITRIWFSPAAVAIFQILFLSLTTAWGIGVLRQMGLPKWGAWLLAIVFAFSPINGNMVITLWKDIPYSTALFLFSIFFLQIIESGGELLSSMRNCLALVIIGLMIALFRHNGFPVPIISLAVIAFIYSPYWKRVILVLSVLFVLWVGIRGPLYRLLEFGDMQGFDESIFFHHVAAYAVSPEKLDRNEMNTLNKILPIDQWEYNCCTLRESFQAEDFNWQTITAYGTELRQLFAKLVINDPVTEINHIICSSSLVWEIKNRCGLVGILPYNSEIWVVENTYGLEEASLIPNLVPRISRLLITIQDNLTFRLFWSPALYLYTGLFCAWIYSRRSRSWKMALFMLPALVQSGILMLVNISADQFRYQYGIYLVGLFSLGLLMVKVDPAIKPEPK